MEKIAIIIDTWGLYDFRTSGRRGKEPLMTVDSFLRKDYVDTVIMAAYSTGESITEELANPWIPATKEYFKKNRLSWDEKIKSDSIMLAWDLTKKPYDNKNQLKHTNLGLKKIWKSWNKPVLFLHQPWEIPKIHKIKEVFFFGLAWDICVKNRPLGYNYWLENTRANLYFDPKGVKASIDIDFDQYQRSKKYPELRTLREVL